MTGLKVIGRVLWSGTRNTLWQLWWYQAAYALEGRQRAGAVVLRAFGTLLILWLIGGTLFFLGWLWYVLPMAWFASASILADEMVGTDLALPSPTEEEWGEDEDAGQDVVMEQTRIGKAPVLKFEDPNNPARTHLVWLEPKKGRS